MNKYYDDGRPHLLQTFAEDELHGIKTAYDESGQMTETRFDHGQKMR